MGSRCRVRRGGHARVPPYPPHIWAGYEGCRSARAFEAWLRSLSRSKNRDRLVTGRPARAHEASLRRLAVDTLSPSILICMILHMLYVHETFIGTSLNFSLLIAAHGYSCCSNAVRTLAHPPCRCQLHHRRCPCIRHIWPPAPLFTLLIVLWRMCVGANSILMDG